MALVPMDVKEDGPEIAEYDACPCFYLNDDQVEALGIKGIPTPGTVMMMHAKVVITRVVAEGEESGEMTEEDKVPDVSMSLKITDMELTKPSSADDIASALYG